MRRPLKVTVLTCYKITGSLLHLLKRKKLHHPHKTMGTTREKLEELNLTREELERLGEAFKKKEFCDLLTQYVEETQNPENIKLYQQEVTQLEKQRGVDVTFINPIPGYVIKTSVDGSRKCFINICCNENISRPVCQPGMEDGTRGLNWSLPHSLSPPREDIDRNRQRCQVFDVVFHPDTLHLASKNKAFAGMVNESACDAIESNFNVKLDRKNLKFPKLKYKGAPHACVIRKLSKETPVECPAEDKEFFDNLYAHMGDIPTSTSTNTNNTGTNTGITSDRRIKKVARKDSNKPDKCIYTTPKFDIKHRTQVELQDFTLIKDVRNVTRPKELVVEINLPLLKSANNISIDVTEKTLQLLSEKPAKYKLNLNLPYPVNQDAGVAKFDKDTKKLTIVLQVKPVYLSCPDVNVHCDSGVELESDHGFPSSPEEVDELIESVLCNKNLQEIPDQELSDCAIYSPGFRTHILDDSVHYTLPEFTCHVYNNTVAFTLQVKNVNEDSVRKLCNGNNSSVQVAFQSISSSFYAMYYAFYVKLPDHKIQDDNVLIETWDNNVILQITFENNNVDLTSYYVGISEGKTTLKYIQEASLINSVLEQSTLEELIQDEQEYKIDNQDTYTDTANNNNNNHFTEDESSQENEENTINSNNNNTPNTKSIAENNENNGGGDGESEGRVSMDIVSVSYESSGDELSCSYSPSKGKGILKRLSKKQFSRSISESSIEDCVFSSSFECHASVDSGIPEEDGEVSRSFKKTVRFNDVVSRQLYRCNSSILGQRKKNQRKAKNKKKAQVRRASESDTSEVDDKKERELKTQSDGGNKEEQRDDNVDPSNNDTDIFHFDFDN